MKFPPLRVSIARLHYRDEVVYGKGQKSHSEKAVLLEHLARKVAVLLDTEEPMTEQPKAHDQLDSAL